MGLAKGLSVVSMFSDFIGKTGYEPVQNSYTRVCITYRRRGVPSKCIEWSIQVNCMCLRKSKT